MIVLTVQQALGYLKELLETNPTLSDLWVAGEISNLSRSAAGHVYFTLKDGGGQLRCVFFRRQNAGMTLEHGAEVVAHGRVSIYEQRGELNFVVDFVHPKGAGILNAQFERLKELLAAEGLFDPARKRPLPLFPRRIGVVTSPTGAVLHDIMTVVGRRWPQAEIVLAPTAVQGDGAAAGVAAALADLNAFGDVDVIIVARGGGSLEELAPFNDERVPRAIYASRVPVVSAVGHETDVTLADYVADLRAPTPSAAAELVVPDQIQIAVHVGGCAGQLEAGVRQKLELHRDRLERQLDYLEQAAPDLAGPGKRVDTLLARAESGLTQMLVRRKAAVETRILQLESLSPRAVLGRGYGAVQHRDGRPITRLTEVQTGERLSVRLYDGAFAAEVKETA